MGHFIRTQSDGTWTTGNYVTTKNDWKDLSRKVFKAVNGDRGGHWAPRPWSATVKRGIKVGGSGLQVDGPTEVNHGGKIVIGSGGQVILANDDWPLLGEVHNGRKRTIVTPATELMANQRYHWLINSQYMAMQSIACTIQVGNGPLLDVPRFTLPLRVHHGSRLTKATLRYRIPQNFKNLPFRPPMMRIVRVDEFGNAQPLRSIESGADKFGTVTIPAAETTGIWYNGGDAKTFEYACDQNNVIDCNQFTYFAEVFEEQGTESAIPIQLMDGKKVRSLWFVKRVIYNTGSATGTTTGLSENEWILYINTPNQVIDIPIPTMHPGWEVGDPTYPVLNGVYAHHPGSFNERVQMVDNIPGLMIAGFEVCGAGSTAASMSTVWETDKDSYIVGDVVRYRAPRPRGNIFHSVTCDFDSISDMRQQ